MGLVRDFNKDMDGLRIGVGYGLRHTISGRWFNKGLRWSSDGFPWWLSPQSAFQYARRNLRLTEAGLLEAVPLVLYLPSENYPAEVKRLLAEPPISFPKAAQA
jgi:hypothetical protein